MIRARHKRSERHVRNFVVESGTVAVGGTADEFRLDLRERRRLATDGVGIAVVVCHDKTEMLVNFYQLVAVKFQRDLVAVLAVLLFSDFPAFGIVEKVDGDNIGQNCDAHPADTCEVEARLRGLFVKVKAAYKLDAGQKLDICFHKVGDTGRFEGVLNPYFFLDFFELFLERRIFVM